jgi:hypothetical protein
VEQWSWREGDEVEVERGRQANGLARGRFVEFWDNAVVCACCFMREGDEWMRMGCIQTGWRSVGQHYRKIVLNLTKFMKKVLAFVI